MNTQTLLIKIPRTSHTGWKNDREDEKISSNTFSSGDTKNGENVLNEKNMKITKRGHAFQGYSSTYNVEIFISFNHELRLKDIESEIKSKLIHLLPVSKGFQSVVTLVLVCKKIESDDKTKYDNFYLISNAKILTNESDIDDMFQSICTII